MAFGGSGETEKSSRGKDHCVTIKTQACKQAGIYFHVSAVPAERRRDRIVAGHCQR
ncbi:hypothetical protein GCM10011585_02740 [Edaphobacter dinghuensis]|uniref:Uncharacterized protein n=1 Tax=Edaphobacter dinghuensis TaxID=1560005 RepID=A0A917H1X4_9BACT|nr:hypothetical protein GCM10011585_02740 [Edaphobacter dinghuensis]